MYIGSTIGAISYTSGAFAFALLVPLCVLLQRQKKLPASAGRSLRYYHNPLPLSITV
jgi:hypothetical protein